MVTFCELYDVNVVFIKGQSDVTLSDCLKASFHCFAVEGELYTAYLQDYKKNPLFLLFRLTAKRSTVQGKNPTTSPYQQHTVVLRLHEP